MKNNNMHGFTLVEIMIVVAIIGLLASIAVPSFIQARNNARNSACINNLRIIDGSKQQYALEYDAADTSTPTTGNISGYIKGNAMPICPAAGTYSINAVSTLPVCSLSNNTSVTPAFHRIPNPN